VTVRKGILGGTFDPPHVAHMIVAQEVREALSLESMLLVPTATHPFKGEAGAGPTHRAAMAELAVAGDPALVVDRLEVERGGTSYTVDTLEALREREPGTSWHLVIGVDNLGELSDWNQADRLPELAKIVVITRGGLPVGNRKPDVAMPESCSVVEVPALEISSTVIRRRVAEGRPIRYWVPPAVEAYIGEHGLYGGIRDTDKIPARG
jgi:nicotinate-nucleotide adenylyltransferase